MKTLTLVVLFIGLTSMFGCQKGVEPPEYRLESHISIIPQVDNLKYRSGLFRLGSETAILVMNDSTKGANVLKKIVDAASDFEIPIIQINNQGFDKKNNYIFIDNNRKFVSEEGYEISVDSNSVYISAMNNGGVMHAIQTLRQLFVNAFHTGEKRDRWYLPCVEIDDHPKFKHRGLLIDCSRHFFEVETIKKYIDLLALYKMNVLHWHLTDDQGWRIEIDAFPKLTEVGAWRTEMDGSRYGGYYSKEDIQEVVDYATMHEINIIPEIELPGHSQAAIAAYPYLSCTGQKVEVANDWGVFKDIYCAGNDSVFLFIETVLDEVLSLFPGLYIHIGGDEAPKYRWEHCDKCQKRTKDENLKNMHELQSYFIARVEAYLNSRGRQLIGWDEILEGGLSTNATVQSWRGMERGALAAKSAHNAIMSPTSHAYFDYDLRSIDLQKVYLFEPVPSNLSKQEADYIIGGECNIWTEHVLNVNMLDSKVFPRLLAMSEVLWSYPVKRNYDEFYRRVQNHYPMLSALGVKYGAETLEVAITTKVENGQSYILAEPGQQDLVIKYKQLGQNGEALQLYTQPVLIRQDSEIEFQAFKGQDVYGSPTVCAFSYHKAIGELVDYKNPYSQWYKSSEKIALVDGRLGSLDFKDGCWQGFWGDDIEVVIAFDTLQMVSQLEAHFYQYNNSWIFMPKEILFEGSHDGITYFELGTMRPKTDPKTRGKHIENFVLEIDDLTVKYIKVNAKNMGKVPDWHEAAGSDAWLFIDEIVVK